MLSQQRRSPRFQGIVGEGGPKLAPELCHTFRHTYSTLLHANGEDPKVVQELLRHSSIKVTMDVYTQAVTATKRKAQSRVV